MALTNWEIAVFALHLLNGATQRVHTEDVALKCHELAPDAFSWIKHVDVPDKEVARTALMDARKEKYGALVTGRAGRGKGQTGKTAADPAADGWQLTDKGIEWLLGNQARLQEELGQRDVKTNRQEDLKSLQRVRQHRLFKVYRDNPNNFGATLGDLAEMLRCRVDSDEQVWSSRFRSLRHQAQLTKQVDISEFLERCETMRPSLM